MTYGALSATGVVSSEVKRVIYPMKEIHFVEYPDPYRNSWGIDGYEDPVELSNVALDSVEKCIREFEGDVAAIITEPIQGDAGVIIPPQEFMRGLKKLTEKYGMLFIDEEVQTGMGRTGRWWAIEHFNVSPDILATAKALGGGMPISATVGRAEIMDSVPIPLFVFTHLGHAVNASAADATISVVKEEGLVGRSRMLGEYALKRFEEMKEKYHIIGDVRGKGMMIGVEFVRDRETKEPAKVERDKIMTKAFQRGLVLLGAGVSALRLAPPLILTREQADIGLNLFEDALNEVERGK